jgi:cytochrome c-type biogenesis protein CcsB
MNRIIKVLFSLQTTLVYLLIFIASIAIATFIENDHGADTAKALVYNTWWFEMLLFLLSLNFIGNIFISKLFRKGKITTLIFHLAFIIIIIGAAVTRYFGEEGTMHIREGQTQNYITTADYYLKMNILSNGKNKAWAKRLLLSAKGKNKLKENLTIDSKDIVVKLVSFLPDAIPALQPSENGVPTISLVLAGAMGREEHHITEGKYIDKNGVIISFGDTTVNADMLITRSGDSLILRSKYKLEMVNMGNQGASSTADSGQAIRFNPLTLYKTDNITMVMKQYLPNAVQAAMPNENVSRDQNTPDALMLTVHSGNDEKPLTLWGGKGFEGEEQTIKINGLEVTMSFGSIQKQVPFSLKLNRFILERYPGSKSPSSFKSNITLIDNDKKYFRNDSIYMNNVLHYEGYRFYQSSYDEDEKGTYLSVNHDMPGTTLTYLGYILLALGMAANLLNPKSRFRWLLQQSSQIQSASKATVITVLISIASSVSLKAAPSDSLTVEKEEAGRFGQMLVQDRKGRVEPVSTLASELVRKITRDNNFRGLSPEQVLLGMSVYPENWKTLPMIRISHPEIQELFHTDLKYVSFFDCFDKEGNYRLATVINDAYKKKPASRSKFDTEIIRADERVNIAYMIYTGQYFNIFPKEGDPEHTWYSPAEVQQNFSGMDSLFASNIFSMYLEAVREFPAEKARKEASTYLESIHNYQVKYGAKVIPGTSLLKLEVLYNKLDPFSRLMGYYGLLGALLLLLQFISIFIKKYRPIFIEKVLIILLLASFGLHTVALLLRWYISGHAPWSNGFESLTYIAWATVLAGVLFLKRSKIALSATALLASVILSVAHLSWMDPEITNVVPVLNSYWLSIHVSIISASYGFFALGALLGFLNLLLMFFRNEKNIATLGLTITQLSYIVEMTLILGLFLVSIGTFLGGVWANESWGRYWGWDPKETWALVTLLVYAFVAHMRFIPSLKNPFIFNFAALISFASVIMTYFGVNFYLSGLHSYGKGDPMPVPTWVFYTLFVVLTISVLAYFNERKIKKLSGVAN